MQNRQVNLHIRRKNIPNYKALDSVPNCIGPVEIIITRIHF